VPAVVIASGAVAVWWSGATLDSSGEVAFDDPLAIPP
jgi:hypothetical protein